MILYFAKHPTFDLIGTASTSQTDSIYFSDNGGQEGEYRAVDGGYRSYGATVCFQPDQSTHVKEMTAPGNYILYKDHNGESVWLTILTCEHDPLAGHDTITAEDASMDLINETVGAYSASKAMKIAEYINLFIADSGFEIGVNEIPTLARTLKWESEETTALARILSVATQFDAELDFRFEISGLTVVKKYIDIYKSIGKDRRTELTVDAQLNDIVTNTDVSDLYTAVYAIGSTPEGSDSPINLKGYQWTDPDNRFVLLSDGSLRDPVANQQWSRLVGKDALASGFINRVKTYEAQTQATLLKSALSDLKQHNHPTVTYTVDIAILPDDVQVGDTVHLRDENEQLFLTARVLELTYSYSTKTGTATLGDYLIEAKQIDPQYRALAEELAKQNKGKDGADGVPGAKGADGRTSYFHTAWADSLSGSVGFTTSGGDGKKYIGTYSDFTLADSPNPADYNWALFKGDTGKDGVAGKDGVGLKSTQIMYAQSTSGTTAPTTGWTAQVPTLIKGQYLWTQTTWVYTDNTGEAGYTVSYNAKDGNTGKDGIAGKDGTGIKSTTITYASSSSGTTAPTSGWTANPPETSAGHYIWTKTVWSYTDGTSETGYSVAMMGATGPAGKDGSQGVAGKAGADGKTPYLHTAWSWSSDGKDRFTVDYPGENLISNQISDWEFGGIKDGQNTNYSSYRIRLKTGVVLLPNTTYTINNFTSDSTKWYVGLQQMEAEDGEFIIGSGWKSLPYTFKTTGTTGFTRIAIRKEPETNLDLAAIGVSIKFKLEVGGSSTIYTPSPSEDPANAYPVYRGEYTDYTANDSTDQTKYTWVKVKGETGPKGDTGPTGPQGVDITSYASGMTLPSKVAPANSQFWLVDTNNVAIKFYKSTGTAWVEQQISASAINAATFNGLSFNGVTFNGSTFKSTYTDVQPDGFSYKVHGDSTLSNGALVTNAYNDSNAQVSHTEVNQTGLLAQGFISGNKVAEISLREGQLLLGATYKASSNAPDRWTSSSLDAETIFQLNQTGKLLWSGKAQLGDGQSITPSLPMTSCLNGWKIGIAVAGGSRFSWFHLAKEKALESPGMGHTIPIFDFNSGGGGMYLHVSNTNLYGDTSVNLKGVASVYYIYEIRAF